MKGKSVLLMFIVVGLLSALLWWLIWGGSGTISGRAVIVKEGITEPVANTDIFLMEASKEVEDFRKASEAYVKAAVVAKKAEAEAIAASESGRKEKLHEASIRLNDARRRLDYARLQLEDSELIKALWAAGVKIFRDVILGEKAKGPNWFRISRTDFDGHFEFKDVSRGKHYVFLSHRGVESAPYVWMVPIKVARGAQTLDLANNNVFLIDEVRAAVEAQQRPVSQNPRPEEKPHRPKWLVDEIAQQQREAEQRQREEGIWRLVETVYEREKNGDVSNVINDVLKNPDKFQSRAITLSLRKDECRRMASGRATAVRRGERKVDTDDRITIVVSDGWRRVTIRDWQCLQGEGDEEAVVRERARADATRDAEDERVAAEQQRLAKDRTAAQLKESEAFRQQLLVLLKMAGSAFEIVADGPYEAFALGVQAVGAQAESIRVKYGSHLQKGEHEALSKAVSGSCSALYAAEADWRKERQAARDLASARDAVDWTRRGGSPTQGQLKNLEVAQRQYDLAKMRLAASKELVTRSMAQAVKAARDDEERHRSLKPPSQ